MTGASRALGAAASTPVADRGRPATRLASFLRTELAPSRARWRATARIVIACLVATTFAMAFRVPNAHWLIVTIFIVSQPNVGASIDKAILRLVGTLIGALGVIAVVVAFPQQPWFTLPLIALLIGTSAFLSRTTAYPYVAVLGGITIVLFFGSAAVHPVTSVDDGLWRLAVIALAEVIATAAQLLLWPDDPEELLLDDLVRVLQAVESRLTALAHGTRAASPASGGLRLEDAVFSALARHLDLLGNAETRYRSLRSRHTEQLVLIGAVNRVATAALTLDTLLPAAPGRGSGAPDAALASRLDALAGVAASLRRALAERRGPGPDALALVPDAAPLVARDAPLLAPLRDLERALAEMPSGMAFLERAPRPERMPWSPLDDGSGSRFFTPACSFANTRDLRYAGQVTLAAMLCYLIVAGLDWPGIGTAMVTCVVVAQSSFGATVQKAMLRIAGAIVGGLLGLCSILLVIPYIDSLPPFLLVVGACSAVAAYVVTGSARISYVGIQIALAFAMTLLDSFGPSIELVKPRDRVLGILLGNVVTAAVTLWVWPVLAGRETLRSVESALRHLATLSRVALSGGIGEHVARPARGFRLQIFQDLASTLRLHGEAEFEPGAGTAQRRAEQKSLLALLQEVQHVFLLIAALVRNRMNVGGFGKIELPSRAALREIAIAIGSALEASADALAGRPPRPLPPLQERIDAADAQLALDAASASDEPGASAAIAELRTQLGMYRSVAPLLTRLVDDARAAAALHRAASERAAVA